MDSFTKIDTIGDRMSNLERKLKRICLWLNENYGIEIPDDIFDDNAIVCATKNKKKEPEHRSRCRDNEEENASDEDENFLPFKCVQVDLNEANKSDKVNLEAKVSPSRNSTTAYRRQQELLRQQQQNKVKLSSSYNKQSNNNTTNITKSNAGVVKNNKVINNNTREPYKPYTKSQQPSLTKQNHAKGIFDDEDGSDTDTDIDDLFSTTEVKKPSEKSEDVTIISSIRRVRGKFNCFNCGNSYPGSDDMLYQTEKQNPEGRSFPFQCYFCPTIFFIKCYGPKSLGENPCINPITDTSYLAFFPQANLFYSRSNTIHFSPQGVRRPNFNFNAIDYSDPNADNFNMDEENLDNFYPDIEINEGYDQDQETSSNSNTVKVKVEENSGNSGDESTEVDENDENQEAADEGLEENDGTEEEESDSGEEGGEEPSKPYYKGKPIREKGEIIDYEDVGQHSDEEEDEEEEPLPPKRKRGREKDPLNCKIFVCKNCSKIFHLKSLYTRHNKKCNDKNYVPLKKVKVKRQKKDVSIIVENVKVIESESEAEVESESEPESKVYSLRRRKKRSS